MHSRPLLWAAAAVFVASALAAVSPVWASPKAESRPATLYLSGVGEGSEAVHGVLREALSKRRGIRFRPLESLLDPAAPKVEAVKKALARIPAVQKLLTNLEVEKGLREISDVVARLEQRFDVVGSDADYRRRYVEALGVLAKARFYAGNEEQARQALGWAVSMDAGFSYDAKRFPPKMKGAFDTVHFLAQELGSKVMEVAAGPGAAEIWVDGKPKGKSRLRARLRRGRHLITARRLGYRSKTVAIVLSSDDELQRLEIKLTPLPGDPLGELDAAVEEARAGKAQVAQRRALALAGVKLLVLGQVVAAKGGSFIELYAVGQRRGVGRARGRLHSAAAAESVFAALFAVPKSGEDLGPKGPGLWSRMTGSRYFWPIVIGVAGAAAVGATVAVVASSESSDRRRRLVPILPLLGF